MVKNWGKTRFTVDDLNKHGVSIYETCAILEGVLEDLNHERSPMLLVGEMPYKSGKVVSMSHIHKEVHLSEVAQSARSRINTVIVEGASGFDEGAVDG